MRLTEGLTDEITLTNGKKLYTGVQSISSQKARKLGLTVKTVRYKGCCIYANINQRAKDPHHFPIEIDGIDIYTYIEEVAEDGEPIV